MFNTKLITHIREKYKELDGLSVVIDNKPVLGTLYNLLTPFLAFTNTLDNQNRLISFYTREGSKQQKLLPFYIGISNYYKIYSEIKKDHSSDVVDTKTLNEKLLVVQKMLPKQFSYLGKTWKGHELQVKIEKNKKIYFAIESIEKRPLLRAPQIQDLLSTFSRIKGLDIPKITENINELQDYLNEFFDKSRKHFLFDKLTEGSNTKVNIKDIIKLGTETNIQPTSGVLLFTNKTKYKQLIKDVKFHNSGISKLFQIAEIKISRNGKFSIVTDGVEGLKPLIYYCSSEYYMGWQAILDELRLKHVNTIVFDDFDNTLKKESRNDYYDFKSFSDELLEAQTNDIIKDVYFLQKDFAFDFDKILKSYGIESYPWLINHKERISLNKQGGVSENNFKVLPSSGRFTYSFWSNFKLISRQLSDEINSSNDIAVKAELLGVIRHGYQLFDRLNSFYKPSSIITDYKDYIIELEMLKSSLNSVSYNNKIKALDVDLPKELVKKNKLDVIVEVIIAKGITQDVLIVSKNLNNFDKEYAREYLNKKTRVLCSLLHVDDLEYNVTKHFKTVFFLTYSGEFTKAIFLAKYCEDQYLVLNSKMEYGYFKYCFEQYTPIIRDLSNFDNKLLLLNLEDQDYLIDKNKIEFNLEDYTDFDFNNDINNEIEKGKELNNDSNESSDDFLSDNHGSSEFDFSFIINNIIKSQHTQNLNHVNGNSNSNTLIFFEDGFIRVPQSKFFYLLLDNSGESNSEIKKKASELERGEKIFLMSGFNDDFNELLEFLKSKYSILEKYFDLANSWRLDLNEKYEELGGYITSLQRYLKSNGIVVTNPTVDRWVTGLTIYPDCLDKIISHFKQQKNSYTSHYEEADILNATEWIAKFRTKLHKEIYLYHIYKNYGMTHQINELELKDIIESLSEVVEVKEILMIQKD